MSSKTPGTLRSRRWFGIGPQSTEHTSHALQAGYSREEFQGRPVIGIVNTWSDMNGSTNAAIHLIAIARRAGSSFTLEDFYDIGRQVPVLANVQPSGKYIMHEFADAGGLPAMLSLLASQLELDVPTVTGASLGENISRAKVGNPDVIRSLDNPVATEALAVLKGNLAPNGCVIKPSAATQSLLQHRLRNRRNERCPLWPVL
jgi:dihydroxyacid dehydratase/phosphogluconate dehydratase